MTKGSNDQAKEEAAVAAKLDEIEERAKQRDKNRNKSGEDSRGERELMDYPLMIGLVGVIAVIGLVILGVRAAFLPRSSASSASSPMRGWGPAIGIAGLIPHFAIELLWPECPADVHS